MFRLKITLRSGAVVECYVQDWGVEYSGETLTRVKWNQPHTKKRNLKYINLKYIKPSEIVSIVQEEVH